MTTQSHARNLGLAKRATLAGLLALFPLVFSACNVVGPAMIIIEGPPTTEEQYKLNKDRPTLILVDDSLNHLPRPRLRQVIATKVQDDLLKEGALTKVIDNGGAYAVISRDREGQMLSLIEVAKAVGAEVVVCATVDTFGVSNNTNQMDLECTVRVRVLDATRDKEPRLWPVGVGEGAKITAKLQTPPSTRIETQAQATQLQNALAEQTGRAIAQLFYEHKRSESATAGK